MKYEWRTNKLKTVEIKNINNEFEKHFSQKISRTKGRTDRGRIYKLMTPIDTLIFYTDGLADKGREVKDYYKLMRNYYPNEKDFISFDERKLDE